jgi:hypothetical protein
MTDLSPADLEQLAFADFAGARIEEVAAYLYATEPQFMTALASDIQLRGVLLPAELTGGYLVIRGRHRMAAAYRAGMPVPTAPAGYGRAPEQTIEHYRWAALRRSFPEELQAWRRHNPNSWKMLAAVAS